MGKGKDFELLVKNHVIERTDEHVDAYRPDFSGNSKHSVADVIVAYPYDEREGRITATYIELKKRQVSVGNRSVVVSGSSTDESGVEELERLVEGTPPWATPYLGVKFPRRQIAMFNANTVLWYIDGDRDYASTEGGTYDIFAPRKTRGDNISMRNSEGWKAGSDDEAASDILTAIGVDDEYRSDTE